MKTTRRVGRLAALLGVVAVAGTGCRGCLTENVVYEHIFNRPDPGLCGPSLVGRPCPPLIPEFEPPPGGPWHSVPTPPPVARPLTVAPSGGGTKTYEPVAPSAAPARPAASLVPEVVDK